MSRPGAGSRFFAVDEERLTQFTDLIGTSIANTESRDALTRLAAEQAALRRVATLVAQGAPSNDVFTAVTEELGRLAPAQLTAMSRYDSDNMFTTVAVWFQDHARLSGRTARATPAGTTS